MQPCHYNTYTQFTLNTELKPEHFKISFEYLLANIPAVFFTRLRGAKEGYIMSLIVYVDI